MKIENGKITEATTAELYEKWLDQGLENIMTFPEYLRTMEAAGCVVRRNSEESCIQREQGAEIRLDKGQR